MTIYYTTTFFILIIEMLLFCILVIPLPSRWRRVMFKFASTSPIAQRAMNGLKIIFGFIFVLFIDAVNRLQRIDQHEPEDTSRQYHDYGYEASQKARKFYAQRNLYLTGFTLFLSLILERTSALIFQMLRHEEELENTKKEQLLSKEDERRLLDMEKSYEIKIKELTEELMELQKDERDFENLKKQIEQQTAEYNRLSDERIKLSSIKE
ncbi:B-cell receptor-associated protein 31-like-domain-containing protein [Cokeromyces recurvatus]|uniref:B-cell receptor-associated protein 31-like-domain-containing protein n=1 Tax=Cokeromyces recurvatus TaxID=90255 RepID=UPI00221FA0D2|nr:B-cell receptor-associated protein 31-like-domain-containing protein [Cokeromyces recurvatus]KAI7901433.1 B-cell receptor-associated protein 31-like-domain-containing protein [Cokeromyces recurvatus]